jgi:hypothetical protein
MASWNPTVPIPLVIKVNKKDVDCYSKLLTLSYLTTVTSSLGITILFGLSVLKFRLVPVGFPSFKGTASKVDQAFRKA